MKTSSKARYALYLVVDIAAHQSTGPVPLREVAQRHKISNKFLEQIAAELCHAGYLKSVRGSQGGYLLSRDSNSITAGDIMRTAEGGFLPVSCLDEHANLNEHAKACPRQMKHSGSSGNCKTAHFWFGLRQTIDAYLDSVPISSLAEL